MRLANGIVIDKEKTFGVLKFSALRREVHVQNEDGTVSEEIKERTYDLKCNTQGRMIQVSVPATVLDLVEKGQFNRIRSMSLNEGDLENSLRTLTRLLCKHHNQEVQTIYKYGVACYKKKCKIVKA